MRARCDPSDLSWSCSRSLSSLSQVLRIDIKAQTAATMGPDLGEGDDKWKGSVRAADGCIYSPPCKQRQVLKINPATQEVTKIGPDWGDVDRKWEGAALGSDGRIYATPAHANKVRLIP